MLHLGKYWGVTMKTFGNIIWFLTVGLLGGLSWFFVGCIWCMTILGIPIGLPRVIQDAQRKVDVNFAGFLGFVTDNLVALIDAVH